MAPDRMSLLDAIDNLSVQFNMDTGIRTLLMQEL